MVLCGVVVVVVVVVVVHLTCCSYSLVGLTLVENDISRFWKALVDNGVNKNGRLWTLPGSVPGIGGVETFYNRECYDDICEKMGKMRRVLVKGTPGIGKTMFLQRLLVDIVEKVKATAEEEDKPLVIPTIDYLTEEQKVVKTYILHSDGTVTERQISRDADYVFSDSVDINRAYGKVLTLEVASDKDKNYNHFLKRIKEAGIRGDVMLMPLCAFDELRQMNPKITLGDCQLRYDIFGGSARNFKSALTGHTTRIDLVEETMLWYFGADIKRECEESWERALSNIYEEFGKSPDQKYNVFNSVMRHRDAEQQDIWASKFMEILASKIYEKREASMFAEIEKLIGSSGVGNFFESISHIQLTTSTTSFNLKPLFKRGAKGVCRDPVSFKFPKHVVRLRNVEDISQLPNNSYGLPVTPNFPLVDAIVQPAVLLQMTVSATEHRGAVNRLQDIRKHLSEKNPSKHKMVFVVPKKNMKTFKYQEDLSDIPQFVLCPDPVLNTMEQNKKRKRVSGEPVI
jgi:hypothetical protein